MNKAETLKRDIDLLPPSMLVEVDDLPADLAEQHDHYPYGVSKK